MLDKTFINFFIGFVVIIGAAFGVLMIAGSQVDNVEPEEIIANP